MPESYAGRRAAEARQAIDRSIAHQVVRLVSSRGDATVIDLTPHVQNLPPLNRIVSLGGDRLRQQVFDELNAPEQMRGSRTPWPKVDEVFRMRAGEVTAWIGPNNEGKSTAVLHVMGSLALAGERCLVASLEMPVKDQALVVSRQQLVRDFGDRARYDRLMDRLDETLSFLDFMGTLGPEPMLALIRYAARELHCQHVVVDNLTKVVPPSMRADEILARFIGAAVLLAYEESIHLHLVGHVRKPKAGEALSRYDWRGTGAASDMVDNVLIVQDNPKKKAVVDNEVDALDDSFDTLLCVDKQRYGPARRRFRFWFNEEQRRLSSGRGWALRAFDEEN
ncbi:MAG TPA: AAA family ATPase [Steroidobacteraceae bacterium]|nr:AAA family ATPase [Steroidobacteraceae bacterium]